MSDTKTTWRHRLDDAIFAAFPTWGAKRKAQRRLWDLAENRGAQMERAWDAADNDRLRGSKWLASRLNVNSALEEDLVELRRRSKDLYRNDGIAASAINGRVKNVIGCGATFQSRITELAGVVDEQTAKDLSRQLEAKFRIWARLDRFARKQRMFERSKAIYGEGLAVISDRGGTDKPIPLTVQIISPERLETPPALEGDARVRLGIRFDRHGQPLTYYFRNVEAEDSTDPDQSFEAVPASRVLHSFEELFPGQIRGVPWMAPAMALMRDLADFRESHLISEQVSALFSVFIKSTDPYGDATGNASETLSSGMRVEDLEPGMIQYLRDGEDVQFTDPNKPGGTFSPYFQFHLRLVAAAIDFPYELLVKHYENSYSGGRLALIDGYSSFRCWQKQTAEDLLEPVAFRFIEECVITGAVDIDPALYADNLETFRAHSWIAAGWSWIDPAKEVSADIDAIDNDLATQAERIASRGLDFEETKEQRFRERMLDLENDAKLMKRRQELAEELDLPAFAAPEPDDDGGGDQQPAEEEPEEVAAK